MASSLFGQTANNSQPRIQQNDIQAAVSQARQLMGGNNPMMAAVRMMTAGKDPEKVFYAECKRMGVNPEDILSMIR